MMALKFSAWLRETGRLYLRYMAAALASIPFATGAALAAQFSWHERIMVPLLFVLALAAAILAWRKLGDWWVASSQTLSQSAVDASILAELLKAGTGSISQPPTTLVASQTGLATFFPWQSNARFVLATYDVDVDFWKEFLATPAVRRGYARLARQDYYNNPGIWKAFLSAPIARRNDAWPSDASVLAFHINADAWKAHLTAAVAWPRDASVLAFHTNADSDVDMMEYLNRPFHSPARVLLQWKSQDTLQQLMQGQTQPTSSPLQAVYAALRNQQLQQGAPLMSAGAQ
jgi:hypothetical protein